MRARLGNLPILVGLVMSVVLHFLAILPLFRSALAAEVPPYDMAARFDPEDFAPHEPEEEAEELLLGIDTPEQRPTVTWIGHQEYQEHLARLDPELGQVVPEPVALLRTDHVLVEYVAVARLDDRRDHAVEGRSHRAAKRRVRRGVAAHHRLHHHRGAVRRRRW